MRQLLGPLGQEALAAAAAGGPREADYLAQVQRLARRFPEPLARLAVEQAILRRRAGAKFAAAGQMYFTREALEQATSEPLAGQHATRFAGRPLVLDLGCGIGGDTLALARRAPVVAVDRDALRLTLLKANAEALGLSGRIHPLQADLRAWAWRVPRGAAAFSDPSRRKAGRRVYMTGNYEPPLALLLSWREAISDMGIKVSPAIERREAEAAGGETEFVSYQGELREAMLWFGGLRTALWRATVLPDGAMLTDEVGDPPLGQSGPREILYEPDPAVMRAGLVRGLGAMLGAWQLDPTIAFLTADRYTRTPFARPYRVLETLPFGMRRLRQALRARGVGSVVLKKRGSPVDTQDLGRRLRLEGPAQATVILTRVAGTPVAILADPLSAPLGSGR